tara:strand:+ start:278 stop:2317 length:2040 start_codon:yes stop_codon:yes gene_type:complete
MATYVNDLRLKEIGTGESSGTWGTETNVNLELIGEALGFGTEAITTNADTHTTTVADGSTDPGRAMYIKYTGTLDSACTITIGPNTMSRLHYIENGTSGSQNIIISQGSGANITIPAGDTKAVYLDGAGSGAAVVDVFASFSAVDLKVQDDLTVTDDATIGGTLGVTGILTCTDDIIIGDGKTIGSASDVDAMTIASNGQVTFTQTLIGTALDISGDIDIDGTANLDVVDIDGAVDMASTLTLAGNADFNGDLDVDGTANLDVVDIDGAVDMASTLTLAGNADFNGDLDVDGTTNLDVVDIDGAVDMASTLQVDGIITTSDGMVITTADNTSQLQLISTDADAGSGPQLDLYRNSGSPADGDDLGRIYFYGENDADEKIEMILIRSAVNDVSDGSEDSQLQIYTYVAGAQADRLKMDPTETVFNESSYDIDFRVENDGDANAFHVTGDKYGIGIGTTSFQSYNAYRGIDIGQQGSIYANNAGDDIAFGANFYLKADGNWAYKTTAVAGMLQMDGNVLRLYDAPSGTANNNISLTTRIRMDADGVKFGSDTAEANALDDYEEGTFTPAYTVAGGGSVGTITGTNVGVYTKIGNLVHCVVRTFFVPTSGSVPTAYNLTLPFQAKNNGGLAGSGSGREIAQTGVGLFILIDGNGTTGVIKATNGAAPPANAYIDIGFTYHAA